MDITSIRSYIEQNSSIDAMMPHGFRSYMTGFDYQTATIDLFNFTAAKFSEYFTKLGDDYRPSGILYESYPFDQIIKFPPESSAYGNRGKHFNCTLAIRWAGSQHDEWIKAWIKDFVREARAIDKREMLLEGKEPTAENSYVTFHLPDHPAEKAFGGNLERLKEVKRKWDPNGRFDKWLNIPI